MEESNQRIELLFKKQRQLDQKREQFWKEHQCSLERLRKSVYSLAELILEKQGVDFSLQGKTEGMLEQVPKLKHTADIQALKLPIKKMELANFYLQDNPKILVEQPFELKQTESEVTCRDQFECLQLQMEKVSPSITEPYSLPCSAMQLNIETPSDERFYHPTPWKTAFGQAKNDTEELPPKPPFKSLITTTLWIENTQNNLKPNPTFRSPITPTPCSLNTRINWQNLPETDRLPVGSQKTPNPPTDKENDGMIFGSSGAAKQFLEKLDSMGGPNNKELAANIEEGADDKMNYLYGAFTVFLLQIQWTVSVPKPFQVH